MECEARRAEKSRIMGFGGIMVPWLLCLGWQTPT